METIVSYIIKQYPPGSKHAGKIQKRLLDCYYYNIQGIGILLYDDPEEQPGLYATAEYYTGRRIRSAPTMQEALDMTAALIAEIGPDKFKEKISEHLNDTGYANEVNCAWCGKPHVGGPEQCIS